MMHGSDIPTNGYRAHQSSEGPLRPGLVLAGRYRLVGEVGRGGMAIVYEAVDQKLSGNRVAVKVLAPCLSHNVAAILRLKREVLTAMRLTHPNIIRVHSFDEDGDLRFLVMEYVDGENLETTVARRGALGLSEVLEVARGALLGLVTAHEQRIVHRDVKPANMMFKTIENGRILKLGDFGIASEVRDTVYRTTGTLASGTLLYMAPELVAGSRPDERADQYSLAVSLYELLAGRPPFGGPATAFQIINVKPAPIPGVPREINAALLQALSKNPDDRFLDCRAFLGALEAGDQGGDPVVSPLPGAPTPGKGFTSGLGLKFAWVQPGSFFLGSPLDEVGRWSDEGPLVRVTFHDGFWMAATPVTQVHYQEMMQANPSRFIGARRPVENVSWSDADRFCRRLTEREQAERALPKDYAFRLPSEAEWEYACRAGTHSAIYEGALEIIGLNNAPAIDPLAWYAGNSGSHVCDDQDSSGWPEKQYAHRWARSHPVGLKKPNQWHLYDMLGNVWEWCSCRFHEDYDGVPNNGQPWESGREERRMLRGGAWNCTARSCRCAARHASLPGVRLSVFGFRCVLVPPPR